MTWRQWAIRRTSAWRSISIRCLAACALCSALFGALGFATVGCESIDTAPPAGMGDPYPAPINDPQISVLSPELRGWIAFQPAVVVNDGRRPMSIQQPVRNLTERQYLIEYRFLFYDDNGMELSPQVSWTFQALDPKQIVRLEGSALSNDAQTYRLEVRWSR